MMRCIGRNAVNARKPGRWCVAAAFAVVLATSAVLAQEGEPEPDPEAAASPEQGAPVKEAPAAAPPPAPASGRRTDVFIPTEKIPADAAISFPVDI